MYAALWEPKIHGRVTDVLGGERHFRPSRYILQLLLTVLIQKFYSVQPQSSGESDVRHTAITVPFPASRQYISLESCFLKVIFYILLNILSFRPSIIVVKTWESLKNTSSVSTQCRRNDVKKALNFYNIIACTHIHCDVAKLTFTHNSLSLYYTTTSFPFCRG